MSIAAALSTIALKSCAYVVTGSVGLLSDAFESAVNLSAALIALFALRLVSRPPDDNHPFGHGKVEYFAAGLEGGMILIAALAITASAVQRLIHPRSLDAIGVGIAISVLAAAVNLAVGMILVRAGRQHRSLTLTADGRHLLTDVWTTAGVVVGVTTTRLTGWSRLDPLVALLVAANIIIVGFRLLRSAVGGLMDEALPWEQHRAIEAVLEHYRHDHPVEFHALRTRQAGALRYITVHVLVPGAWTVQEGHDLIEGLERELRRAVPAALVFTHLEPIEDPRSWDDQALRSLQLDPSRRSD